MSRRDWQNMILFLAATVGIVWCLCFLFGGQS